MDCSKGLDLLASEDCLEPKSNQSIMTIKLLMRKGTASCLLGQFSAALVDYHQANTKYISLAGSELSRLNGVTVESLQEDIARLKKLHDASSLKEEADALLADAFKAKALEKYNEALLAIPVHVSCISNRSACKLSMGDTAGCVEDCSLALSLLQHDSKPDNLPGSVANGAMILFNFM